MRILYALIIVFFAVSCKNEKNTKVVEKTEENPLIFAEEVHFKSLKQVTFGGDNAEAYWSFDD